MSDTVLGYERPQTKNETFFESFFSRDLKQVVLKINFEFF